MRSRRHVLALGFLIGGLRRAQADPGGWRAARWGMSSAELDVAFRAQIRPLAGRMDFGPYVVERQIDIVTVGYREFVALFQMDRRTRRLRQVLLRFRGSRPTRADADAVHAALKDELETLGTMLTYSDYSGTSPSFGLSVQWLFASTGVILRYLDPNAEPGSGVRKELLVRYFAV